MPEIFRFKNIIFYFYSNDHEPIHVHVRHAEKRATIEVASLKVKKNKGFKLKEIKLLVQVVKERSDQIEEMWHDHFKEKEKKDS